MNTTKKKIKTWPYKNIFWKLLLKKLPFMIINIIYMKSHTYFLRIPCRKKCLSLPWFSLLDNNSCLPQCFSHLSLHWEAQSKIWGLIRVAWARFFKSTIPALWWNVRCSFIPICSFIIFVCLVISCSRILWNYKSGIKNRYMNS